MWVESADSLQVVEHMVLIPLDMGFSENPLICHLRRCDQIHEVVQHLASPVRLFKRSPHADEGDN